VGVRGSGRELLLIHGLNANLAFWQPALLRELGARHFLVMYDQRGHGRSDMPPSGYTSSELAQDAAAVLNAYGVGECDVIAHSLGSTVALQLASLFPARVRSLILLDARLRFLQPALKLGDWPEFERWKRSLGEAGERLHADLPLDFMLPLYLANGVSPRTEEDLVANGFAPIGGGRRGAERYRRLIEETTAAVDYEKSDGLDISSLHALECEVLLIYGERSPFLDTLNAVRRELPRCEARLVADAGHNFPVRFPERTAALVQEFLDRRELRAEVSRA
jgi:pimeloyl-ACP methyl ester carboxylesterase